MPKETSKKSTSKRIAELQTKRSEKKTEKEVLDKASFENHIPEIKEDSERKPEPTRDSNGNLFFSDYPGFRPNLSPQQVLEMGSFGGTYFRPIYSSVTKKDHHNEWEDLPSEWFKTLPAKKYKSSKYDNSVNKYGVSCGGDLHMWESNGWIKPIDPYGWFQWYCMFYLGRRCSDDERQISRGLGVFGPSGRWRRNLINKCVAKVKDVNDIAELETVLADYRISPKIRQLLQHWGYQITVQAFEKDA
jgi:hypothetical protein